MNDGPHHLDGHPDCDTRWMPPECRQHWQRWVISCGPDMQYPQVDKEECDALAVAFYNGWEAGGKWYGVEI